MMQRGSPLGRTQGLKTLANDWNLRCISLVVLWMLAAAGYGEAQTLEKVRIGMPSLSLSFIAPQVAMLGDFFGKKASMPRSSASPPTSAWLPSPPRRSATRPRSAPACAARSKGCRSKWLTYFNGRPLHVLVARPELKTLADLRRKIIGFAGYGDSTEFMLRAILRQAGMELEKDVQAFQVSGSGQRLQALLSGKMDAAIVPPPFNFEAESKGFVRLMAAADVFETSVSGLALHVDTLRDKPAQVKSMLRALLKAQNLSRTIKRKASGSSPTGSNSKRNCPASYDIYVKGMSSNGIVPRSGFGIRHRAGAQRSAGERSRAGRQGRRFRHAREALNELGMQ